jgi:hypothetical protein
MVTGGWFVRTSIALGVLAVWPCPAAADDQIVCGRSIVRVGMTASEISAKCGEPTEKTVADIPIRARNARGGTFETGAIVKVERWTFDRGFGRFPAILTFTDGKLQSIELVTR